MMHIAVSTKAEKPLNIPIDIVGIDGTLKTGIHTSRGPTMADYTVGNVRFARGHLKRSRLSDQLLKRRLEKNLDLIEMAVLAASGESDIAVLPDDLPLGEERSKELQRVLARC